MTDATLEAAVGNLDLGTQPETSANDNAEEGTLRIGRRCYIGNLAWGTSWQDLKDKFRDVGSVVYANVVRDDSGRSKGWGIVEFETPQEAVAAVNQLNGVELKGRNMLVREDREDRDVKAYNRAEGRGGRGSRPRRDRRPRGGRGRGDGREAAEGEAEGGDQGGDDTIAADRPPRRERPPRRDTSTDESTGLQIVIQGLPWSYTQEQLEPMFEPYGIIEQCEVVYGRDGRSRGYGTVRYESTDEAQDAIDQLHGTELEGRTLTVRLDKYA